MQNARKKQLQKCPFHKHIVNLDFLMSFGWEEMFSSPKSKLKSAKTPDKNALVNLTRKWTPRMISLTFLKESLVRLIPPIPRQWKDWRNVNGAGKWIKPWKNTLKLFTAVINCCKLERLALPLISIYSESWSPPLESRRSY